MKRCPTCNRTYTDDRMTNCGHDGTPLMSTAYSPPYGAQQAPHAQVPQGYPPPPQGYVPQGTPWQNYPPQGYPPPPGWQMGSSEYVPCPRCTRPYPEQVKFTWWGGLLGPRLFKHVKCIGCGLTYNGKSGQSNTTNIVIYSVVLGVIAFAVVFLIFSSMR
jgi:transposase-like protein